MMRILVPILALILMVAVVLAFLKSPPAEPTAPPLKSAESTELPADQPVAPETPVAAEPATPDEPAPAVVEAAPTPEPEPEPEPVAAIAGLHVLPPAPDAESRDASLGSSDAADTNPYLLKIDLTKYGAGYKQITLSKYTDRVTADDPYVIAPLLVAPNGEGAWKYPMAAHYVTINGAAPIVIDNKPWTLAESTASVAQYELTIAGESDAPVLRIVRRYELDENTYDLRLKQTFVNLTDQPLRVVMRQSLQGDIDLPKGDYLGERQRQVVTGYVNPNYDAATVFVKKAIRLRTTVLDKQEVWPYKAVDEKHMAWLASENRYFVLVVHPLLPPDAASLTVAPYLDQQFASFGIDSDTSDQKANVAVLAAKSPPLTIGPGATASLDLALFAGPRDRDVFAQPIYKALNLAPLVRYEMSSSCAVCTFQWLAKFLLAFLETIHAVLRDWGLAIIVLVLVVRLLLHPITKRAQINMMTMGKKMQLLQPEMDKLKKKYKDDQAKLNQEMMRLYREKGFNPAGFLGGCLPMFLQMPIWIALYAMLYFAIELRQEPAFYGLFQLVSGGHWHFLQDLSQPDNFIRFVAIGQESISVPFPFIDLHISGINILPLLMAVVFYFQQKFTTPPPANEQAAQQQKIMKFMVLLFPIFLYSAPSGLTLYILASTSAGILDSYIVRKHVREQEESGKLFEKKPIKPGSFRDRMMKKLEQKQAEMAERQKYRKKP